MKTHIGRRSAGRIRSAAFGIELLESRRLLSSGAVDSSFASNGQYNLSLASQFNAAAYQSNGDVILAGAPAGAHPIPDIIYTTRLTPTGAVDQNFGIGGLATAQLPGAYDIADAVAVQPDGKILVAATTVANTADPSSANMAVLRYNSDGSLDTTFGTNGVAYTTGSSGLDARALAIAPNGSILVSGQFFGNGAVVEFNSDGVANDAFGTYAVASLPEIKGDVTGLAVDNNGFIYAAGSSNGNPLRVIRLTSAGVIDTSYGTSGVAQSISANVDSSNLILQNDGSVLVAGATPDNNTESIFYFNSSGEPYGFGPDGAVSVSGIQGGQIAVDDTSGTVYLAGVIDDNGFDLPTKNDFAIDAFTASGSPDTNFGFNGQFAYPLSPANGTSFGVAVSPTGEVLQYGESGSTSSPSSVAVLVGPALSLNLIGTPVANAGVSYTVNEGYGVELNGSNSTDFTSSISEFAWDMNYTGTFIPDAYGATPFFSAAALAGPSTVTVALQVTDATGAVSSIETAKITIQPVAPTATITRNYVITSGGTAYIGLTNPFNPSSAEVAAGFTYSYDFTDSGTFNITNTTASQEQIPPSDLLTLGVHTARVRISDTGGAYTDYTSAITVQNAATAAISGTVFMDTNVDGQYDGTDYGLQNETVYLDSNNNGVLDSGEPSVVTGSNGAFSFTGLVAGTYTLRLLPVANGIWAQDDPANNAPETIILAAGQVYSTALFGVRDTTAVNTISGMVYSAVNNPPNFQSGDPLLAGVIVYLDTNNDGILDNNEVSTTTNSQGQFTFTSSVPGNFIVRAVAPAGMSLILPSSSGGAHDISFTDVGGSYTAANFAFSPTVTTATITGEVYDDINGNGKQDSSEPGLAGVSVYLDLNKAGVEEAGYPVVATTSTGAFTFTSVSPGTYEVREVLPTGYKLESPSAGYTSVTVTAQQTLSGVVFADVPAVVPPTPLAGTVIGTIGSYQNDGNTAAKAFDGNLTTFFDGPTANGNWVGLDLGAPYNITSLSYASRSGWASRMNGGIFQASNSSNFSTGVVNLYTIPAGQNPPSTSLTTQSISTTTGYRYVRYLSPAGSYGDVAEVQFFGTPATVVGPSQLTGTTIGTAGSYQNDGNTIAKATDGNLSTFFDGSTANGNWVGLDLGTGGGIVTEIKYASRSGWASRMNGGIFQASNSAAFTVGVVNLYTIASNANPSSTSLTVQTITNTTAYRYYRYLSPAGSYGDVSEVQFFGTAGGLASLTQFTGTAIGTTGSYQNDGNTIAKAVDGNLATFFDGAAANGNWAGLDLGSAKIVKQISFAPRSSWASRMVGGIFQASNTADFSSGVVSLYTITAAPATGVLTSVSLSVSTSYRYYRYLSPAESYGDIAEFEVFG